MLLGVVSNSVWSETAQTVVIVVVRTAAFADWIDRVIGDGSAEQSDEWDWLDGRTEEYAGTDQSDEWNWWDWWFGDSSEEQTAEYGRTDDVIRDTRSSEEQTDDLYGTDETSENSGSFEYNTKASNWAMT